MDSMTPLERMTLIAALAETAYDRCCPDVGMGPTSGMILDRVLKKAHVGKKDIRYELVLERMSENRQGGR